MQKFLKRLRRTGRRANEIISSYIAGGTPCGTCGFAGKPLHREVLWPELVAEWELTPEWHRWMDEREGSCCTWCGSSLRSGLLAAAIVAAANRQSTSSASHLNELFRNPLARKLAIAEINSAGNLHRYLTRCPGLRFSEFGSTSPAIPSEDLMQLSYESASFDLVITSDTLEHVPDIDRALSETCRILKPGGMHVFSVPVVWDRPTRRRAALTDGVLTHFLPPSYHGAAEQNKTDFLVFNEFGADFPATCARAGYEVELLRHDVNPAVVTFIAHKPLAVESG